LPPIKIFFSKIPHKWGDMQPPIYGGGVDYFEFEPLFRTVFTLMPAGEEDSSARLGSGKKNKLIFYENFENGKNGNNSRRRLY
jgi:hypothetical protein